MTQTVTLVEGVAHVFVAADHCNSECVGIHANGSANRFQALEPVRQGVRPTSAPSARTWPPGSSSGSNYMSDFQSEIAFLGIDASPSFVRQPEGNGVAELHSHPQGEPAVGAELPDHRGVARGAARVRRIVQHSLAGRPSSPQDTRSGQGRPAANQGLGRMNDAAACLITLAQYRRQHRRRQWHLWLKRSGYAGYFFGVGVNGTLLKAVPNGESAMNISRRVFTLIILLLLSVPSLAHAQIPQCGLPLPCEQGTASDGGSLTIGNSGNGVAITGVGGNQGVFGYSLRNDGVHGITAADDSAGTHAGVYGEAAQGDGVIGTSSSGLHAGVTGYNSSEGDGIYGESESGYAGYFFGDVAVTGTLEKAAGSFKIDHPLDPTNQTLSHSFVESPDMMNIYNGNAITDAHGDATVSLPAYFESLNRDFRYQLTVIEQFAQAIISSEIKDNRFTIKTDKPGVKVSWMVTGVRQDAYANAHRISVEEYKAANERGKYMHPALYGQPKEMGVNQSRSKTLQMQMEAEGTAR